MMNGKTLRMVVAGIALGLVAATGTMRAQISDNRENPSASQARTQVMVVAMEQGRYLITQNGGSSWGIVEAKDIASLPQNILQLIKRTSAETPSTAVTAMPNPARERITLRYALPQPGNVSVALFDMTGQQVLTKSQQMFQTGEHADILDISSLPGGAYYYRIIVDGGAIGNGVVTVIR
ncbi:MAG: T9SS type A sorting domain-containing protein [Bacteroidota bacterium]